MSLHFGQSHEKEMELQLSTKIELFVCLIFTYKTKMLEKCHFCCRRKSNLFWTLKMGQKCVPSSITMKNYFLIQFSVLSVQAKEHLVNKYEYQE